MNHLLKRMSPNSITMVFQKEAIASAPSMSSRTARNYEACYRWLSSYNFLRGFCISRLHFFLWYYAIASLHIHLGSFVAAPNNLASCLVTRVFPAWQHRCASISHHIPMYVENLSKSMISTNNNVHLSTHAGADQQWKARQTSWAHHGHRKTSMPTWTRSTQINSTDVQDS